jgi:hypothetical protein
VKALDKTRAVMSSSIFLYESIPYLRTLYLLIKQHKK